MKSRDEAGGKKGVGYRVKKGKGEGVKGKGVKVTDTSFALHRICSSGVFLFLYPLPLTLSPLYSFQARLESYESV
jgi:hypothetical protein